MHNGYIKLHRKFTQWEWYRDNNTMILFIHLLLTANYKPSRFMGHEIPIGAVVVGRKALAEATGMTERKIRTSLDKLKSTGEVTIKTTNKFSVLTIVKYSDYQDREKIATSKKANNRPTTDQQPTTSKEGKKERRKEIKDNAASVIDTLNSITGKSFRYGDSNLRPIIARMNEGHSTSDFEVVIRCKHDEWSNDDKMKSYVRPETLFGSKFDSYLQASGANGGHDPFEGCLNG